MSITGCSSRYLPWPTGEAMGPRACPSFDNRRWLTVLWSDCLLFSSGNDGADKEELDDEDPDDNDDDDVDDSVAGGTCITKGFLLRSSLL